MSEYLIIAFDVSIPGVLEEGQEEQHIDVDIAGDEFLPVESTLHVRIFIHGREERRIRGPSEKTFLLVTLQVSGWVFLCEIFISLLQQSQTDGPEETKNEKSITFLIFEVSR